ncbi:MAG: putative DNA modification/repair radical SAM protein [Rubricoccaceae bacterium]|nr:putative DNA modification/repair radical SAM protein [Rubricoccaceae bacterium]
MRPQTLHKLEILADAAKYDVSCASSGSDRPNTPTGLGNSTGMGICHSYTEDGRCVSLLKILLTNHCIYDCAFCVSRRSSDVQRAAFTVDEVVELTIEFYRRNYIEGLFLSSGIFKDADTTSSRLVAVAQRLREDHDFNGYIHLKVIPGTSHDLLETAGRYADRLSVNLEIATERELKRVAPEKDHQAALVPMGFLGARIAEARQERTDAVRRATPRPAAPPRFAPGGQSTQLVVGATQESDATILDVASRLYRANGLRRVYYSGYVPIDTDDRVPSLDAAPLRREHRLYQADWLLRRYGFDPHELFADDHDDLDLFVDPKTAYALRHPHRYPVDVNRASRRQLLRVPGIGHRSADRILLARRQGTVRWEHLQRMGVVLKRARYFITVAGHRPRLLERAPDAVYARLRQADPAAAPQLSLF